MAIALTNVTTTGQSHSGNSEAVSLTSASTDDIVIACFAIAGMTTETINVPAGWTQIANGFTSNNAGAKARTVAYWHRKLSGETTATFSWTSTLHYTVIVASYSGCNPIAPIESGSYAARPASGATWSTNAVVTSAAGRWVVGFAQSVATGSAQTFSSTDFAVERSEGAYTSSTPYNDAAYYDTNGAVSTGSHTYNITTTGAPPDGGIVSFALVPGSYGTAAVSATASTTSAGRLAANGTGSVSSVLSVSAYGALLQSGSGSVVGTLTVTADGIDVPPVVPELKQWQQGDSLDADTLNEQWRDIFGVLFGDGRPIIYASYQGSQFNLTSPQAMPLDTVSLQRGDIQLTPGDSKIYAFTAGWYEGVLQGAFNFNGATSSYTLGTQLRVNGTTDASSFNAPIAGSLTSSDQVLGGHPFTVYLNAGDYVEVVQYGDSWVSGKVRSSTANGGTRVAMWWGGRS